jgi:Putative transposase
MTLDAAEFIRRFLLHVLPSGFRRRTQTARNDGRFSA